MKQPTAREITKARAQLSDSGIPPLGVSTEAMFTWEGVGWHKDEVLLGIFIGLKIAENREAARQTLDLPLSCPNCKTSIAGV